MADPRAKSSTADLQKQFQLALQVRDRINDVVEAAQRVEDIQGQLDKRVAMAKEQPFAKRVGDVAKPVREKLEGVRSELFEVGCHADQCSLDQPVKLYNILITTNLQVQTGDYAPTRQHGEIFADFSGKVGEQLRRLQAIEDTDLTAVNTVLRELGLPAVYVANRKGPTP
jgi:hypothetical protein